MSHNTFGKLFRVTTWGESHGPAIGCIVDGTPPLIELSESDIQIYLDKRKPGTSKYTSQRKEPDRVKILSGVFNGKTTGTPISLIIENIDYREKDYNSIKDKFRPGHADYTYLKKYGIRDHRGGGRQSARETACRVAAGAIALKLLKKFIGPKILIRGAVVQIGNLSIERKNWDWKQTYRNPFWCPDKKMVAQWEEFIKETRKKGSSAGAILEIVAAGVPVGLGAPVYGKLDADLASAIMSINAVKSVEIGAGKDSVVLAGEKNADNMRFKNNKISFESNFAGGILGGISSGQEIITRFAVKPTSSVVKTKKTITRDKKNVNISTIGRHDPCVGIRAVPVGEAMMTCVLADHFLRNRAQCG